ncbi:MAG: hypothetical protein K2N87_13275 [Eubacterium sp.]|nr:hypothetical protein [Eubacterium sp.]
MKSKISLFNKAIWKRNVTGGWCLWAGLLLFYLLLLPVSQYGAISQMLRNNIADSPSSGVYGYMMLESLWRMPFYVMVFAIAALLCAMYVFSYLFTGRNSNMMHTYPVSRVSLFVTNYVTGLSFLLIPAVVAALLALAGGASLGVVTGDVVKYYMLWIVTAVVENMFFFSMAVCVLMFVGNIIAVPVLYLILNFLYDGCLVILDAMLSTVCFGIDSLGITGNGVSVMTPIIYLSRAGARNIDYEGTQVYCTLARMHVLPGYFAAAVAFALIALAAYGKKHIETAGDVITVNWLKPIFRWGAAICTASIGALFFVSVFDTHSFTLILCSVVLIGILVFFAAQMLLERSVHVFSKRKIRECAIYSVIVCACYLALDMDVAGLEKKIPSVDEVQAVQMRGTLDLISMEQEQIAWVHDIHSQIIASRKELKRTDVRDSWTRRYVTIEYLLKDNSTLSRSYLVPSTNPIYTQVVEYAGLPEVELAQIFGVHYPDIEVYGGKWEYYSENGDRIEKRISESDAKQLCEAVESDIKGGSLKKGLEPDVDIEEAQTFEYIGSLTFEIRDEAGYINVRDYRSLSNYRNTQTSKDGESMVYVDSRYSGLLEKMRELEIL